MSRMAWTIAKGILLALAVLGIVLYAAMVIVERRFTGWAYR